MPSLKSDRVKLANEQRCAACPLSATWPKLHHPKINPDGSAEATVYVVGDAPSSSDDAEGNPFTGQLGKVLKDALVQVGLPDTRNNNIIRCKPPSNATPTWHSIEACRKYLEEDLLLVKPKVVIPLGTNALKWFLPGSSILAWSGKPFPKTLNGESFWVVPALSPSYILRNPDKAVYQEYLRALRMAKTVLETYPDASAAVKAADDLGEGEYCMTLERLLEIKVGWMNLEEITIDLETSGFDPLTGEILTVALTDQNQQTIVFPICHPEAPDYHNFRNKLDVLEKILASTHHLVAQNATFEIRWLMQHLPSHAAHKYRWDDTMVMSYLLDSRPVGIHDLDTLALTVLGISNFKESSDVNVANLRSEPLFKVMKYNGRDAIATSFIAKKLRKKLLSENLMHGYRMHRARLGPLSALMAEGLPFNKELATSFLQTESTSEKALLLQARQYDIVEQYEQAGNPPFNPMSQPQVKKLLVGCGMIASDDATDEEILSKVDHPIAKNILQLRGTHKLVKFYEDYISKVHPVDGKIHANFHHTFTVTGRLSSSHPNLQNLKKGSPRSIISAPPGMVFIGADYGQLEACVIAALSQDRYFINAIRNGLDIHADCAKDLAALDKRCARLAEKDFKKFRASVKNLWVFPAFYMACVPSLAMYMGLSLNKAQKYYDEFWVRFRGVHEWQQKILRTYDQTGYVWGPTGRRYGNIIGVNGLVNYPVQGSASDLVVEAGNRAVRVGMVPAVNVHDELLWCVPEDAKDTSLETVKEILLAKPNPVYFGWLTVPLSITLKIGKDWGRMEEIGKYTSSWTCVLDTALPASTK